MDATPATTDSRPDATDSATLLASAAGTWSGEWTLWFDPTGAPAATSASRATVASELRGRTLLLRYSWTFDADEHEGLALLGAADDGTFQFAWTETFGYAGNILACTGLPGGAASALGHYDADGQKWGWRTAFTMPDPDTLEMRAWNIEPGAEEQLATLATWSRVD